MPMIVTIRAWIVVLVCCISAANAQNLELPKLPYDYNDLEPWIDDTTMHVHHMGHHMSYVKTINTALAALRGNPDTNHLAKMGLDKLLKNLDKVPEDLQAPVRNGGGGFVNHILFWGSMIKNGTRIDPKGALLKAIEKDIGGMEKLEAVFKDKATKLFGSGWCWIVYNTKLDTLSIETTINQDTPVMVEGKVPLLGLDVWEHAYYLKYKNKRFEYIDNFWQIVDWKSVQARYGEARDGVEPQKKEL